MISDWQIALDDNFDLILSPETARRWHDTLKRQCEGLAKGELAEAIEWGSYIERDQFAGKPKLRELRTWVFRNREQKRHKQAVSVQSGSLCVYCASGWIPVESDGHITEVPCLCRLGQEVLRNCYPATTHEHLKAQATIGMEQAKERKAAAERLNAEWEARGRPGVGVITQMVSSEWAAVPEQSEATDEQ